MQSVTLLGTTSGKINVTGEAQRGAGFSNTIGNNHTVSIGISNFIGRIWIEGSIESNPGDADWVPIPLIGSAPYLQFPMNPTKPISELSAYGQASGDTGNFVYNFTGNFIWVRARVDRTYIAPPPVNDSLVGSVIKILMNYGSVTPAGLQTANNVVSGLVGPPGPRGLPGPTGPSGYIGRDGTTGATGPAGISTNTGATGPFGPQGLIGPTGPAGSSTNTGATGPQGPAGSGGDGIIHRSFKVNFNSNGSLGSISSVPVGWTVVKSSATAISISHNENKKLFMVTAEGQVVAGSNATLNYTIGPLKTVASSFQVTYQEGTSALQAFNIISITSPNVFGTVNSGESTVYVYFI